MASRNPFGAKASPPTVDVTSRDLVSLLTLRTNAVLPADQAKVPSGPKATWSIQRFLSSVAAAAVAIFASVTTTRPSSPPVTIACPLPSELRIAPE